MPDLDQIKQGEQGVRAVRQRRSGDPAGRGPSRGSNLNVVQPLVGKNQTEGFP